MPVKKKENYRDNGRRNIDWNFPKSNVRHQPGSREYQAGWCQKQTNRQNKNHCT